MELLIDFGPGTKEATIIKMQNNVSYWDTPGINQNIDYCKPPYLAFLHSLDKIFVLFDSDIQSVATILRVLNIMKKEIVVVRTKCDNWNQNHKRTVSKCLENDL